MASNSIPSAAMDTPVTLVIHFWDPVLKTWAQFVRDIAPELWTRVQSQRSAPGTKDRNLSAIVKRYTKVLLEWGGIPPKCGGCGGRSTFWANSTLLRRDGPAEKFGCFAVQIISCGKCFENQRERARVHAGSLDSFFNTHGFARAAQLLPGSTLNVKEPKRSEMIVLFCQILAGRDGTDSFVEEEEIYVPHWVWLSSIEGKETSELTKLFCSALDVLEARIWNDPVSSPRASDAALQQIRKAGALSF